MIPMMHVLSERCVLCLQVGDPGGKALTYTEQRSHFALWALIKSPLLIGADLRCDCNHRATV